MAQINMLRIVPTAPITPRMSSILSAGGANYSNTTTGFQMALEQAYNNGIDLLNGIANPQEGLRWCQHHDYFH